MRCKVLIGMFIFSVLIAGTGLTVVPTPDDHSGASPVQPAPASHTLSFTFTPPEISHTGDYCSVAVAGASSCLRSDGGPIMPQRTETMHLPAGTTVTDVTVRPGRVHHRQLPSPVLPALEAAPVGQQSAPQRRQGAIYEGQNTYPASWTDWHTGVGLHGGQRVTFLSLQIFPARYNPATRKLHYVVNIRVEVAYRVPQEPLSQAHMYDLLIVAPEKFGQALQPLVDHKEQHGLATKLVTIGEIYSGEYFTVQGEDDPAHIKYFVKDTIEEWGVQYLMLVGDIETVPSRLVYNFWGGRHYVRRLLLR